MPHPWLCLWDRTLDLPKAQLLPGETFKGWINLLMIANRFGQGGKLPDIDQVAFGLRTDIVSAKCLIESLVKAKLIDRTGSSYLMHDWESWQSQKRTNSERSKAWREEQRALAERSEDDVGERSKKHQTSAHTSAQGALRAPGTEQLQNSTEKPPMAPRKRRAPVDFDLPSWIPENDWNDWLEMRKAKRVPTTFGAMHKGVRDLEKLRGKGFDPADILQNATLRGYTGLFEPYQPYANGKQNGESVGPSKPKLTPEERKAIDDETWG